MFVTASNIWVNGSTRNFLYDEVNTVPKTEVAMVLGTSRTLPGGRKNLFFEYRIRAAVDLFKAGKINRVVVSGDNSQKNYNEPSMMKEELVRLGVPECKITCDFAGLRTFDSILRMKKVFGQNKFIVISQKFHNQRAVFIARKHGMDVIGFNAKDVEGTNGLKTHIREYFARARAVIDLYVWPAKAKFLGKMEELGDCY
ncbi:MAG TPA: ElyC/SanA/YdcF family protein [Flavobacteriales bacterium]|nr:ElyC/SanA/YdcF family protein [Flavobacteriales bacterium]